MGKITSERENELTESTRHYLRQKMDQHPAYATYLAQWDSLQGK